MLARRGECQVGEALARQAVALSRDSDYVNFRAPALLALAEVLTLAEKPTEAAPAVEEALALYEEKGNVVMAERARSQLAEIAA